MTDKLTAQARSENMRRIRSRDTNPELAVRRSVHGMGYRFRLHVNSLPGRPDLVLPRHHKIIQVHGCFWHSHTGCPETHVPLTRRTYWGPKLARNKQRDKQTSAALRRLGWRVLVVWECQTKNGDALKKRLQHFLES